MFSADVIRVMIPFKHQENENITASALPRRHRKLKAVVLIAVLVSAVAVWQRPNLERQILYPYPYRITVESYADRYDVDSSLAAAVIRNESRFRHNVHSHRGAVGLMQLMPDTAHWISEQIGDARYTGADDLHDPDVNVRFGIWYLGSLQEEFRGNDVLALAAYNAGRGNVQEWIQTYGWDTATFSDVNAIPFSETRNYVRKVLNDQKKYRELYPR